MDGLIDALGSQTEGDMERFACSEAVDCMQAYYEVARKKFTDDFSNLAVEKCLLEPLAEIFCPQVVDTLASDVVENIAAEDESSQLERRRLQHKKAKLHKSLLHLNRLDRHNASVLTESDESPHLDSDSVGTEPARTDDVQSLKEFPTVANGGTVFESEVDEFPGTSKKEKKKKHPFASRWEVSD